MSGDQCRIITVVECRIVFSKYLSFAYFGEPIVVAFIIFYFAPFPPPLFLRPSNISENTEWSALWLITSHLRKMVPLPTYQTSVAINFGDQIDAARASNVPEIPFGANVTASPPVHVPEADANDISLVPVSRRAPSTAQECNNSCVSPLITQITLLSCPISSTPI